MAEYIDREALRKILENWRDAHADVDDEQGCGLLEDVICEVDAQTAADVAPVVHGEWKPNELGGCAYAFYCSQCGYVDGYPFNDRHKYCPNCGAKMDRGDEDAESVD